MMVGAPLRHFPGLEPPEPLVETLNVDAGGQSPAVIHDRHPYLPFLEFDSQDMHYRVKTRADGAHVDIWHQQGGAP